MSARRSLAIAVRDRLRMTTAQGGLALTSAQCEVMFDGRPAPSCGDLFFAVHQGRVTNRPLDQGGDASTFGTFVTITSRTKVPFDRVGTDQLDVANGLDDWAEKVWFCIYKNQWDGDGNEEQLGVMNAADATLGANVYHWTEALYPTDISLAEPVRADWFSATEQSWAKGGANQQNVAPFVGLKIVVTFQGAVRMQELTDGGA